MEVMRYISAAKAEGRKLFAWLVDPEKAEAGPTPSLPTKGGGRLVSCVLSKKYILHFYWQ